ncbi:MULTISPECIES: hypothetical protein [unclassified Microcoleus]|uniref:hypothetical protein n=1 Tax=unclassified Microcoleus TaxID=2642155 RepID=UPI002FD21223
MLATFLLLLTAPLNDMKNQLEEISIGQLASVLCVASTMYSSVLRDYKHFPVLPILPYPPHSDSKVIGFDDLHLHYDYRFWWDGLAEEVFNDLIYENPSDWPSRIQRAEDVIGEPFLKKMVCVREMPFLHSSYSFITALEEAYKDHTLTNDICPHQGYKTFPSLLDGCQRICPGHGLGFRDGKVCKRSQ